MLREGNVLILAHTTLEVAEACSGIRSLVSLITLGIVYGYFMDSRTWVRALIVASAIPVAIVANGARVAGTGMVAHWIGPEAADGFFHEFSGWIVFLFAFVMILIIQRLITKFAPQALCQLRDRPACRRKVAYELAHQSDRGSGGARGRDGLGGPGEPGRGSAHPDRLWRCFRCSSANGRACSVRRSRDSVLEVLGLDDYLTRYYYNRNREGVDRLHRVLAEPAAGRRDSLAAELPARARAGSPCRRES